MPCPLPAAATLLALAVAACATAGPVDRPASQERVNPDARALAAFTERVEQYLAIHRKAAAGLPEVGPKATPEQIDTRRRELRRRIAEARLGARAGDVFTSDVRPVVRRLLAGVFTGPGGGDLKASIMDENPGPVRLAINTEYPATLPLSTVPPQVLQVLPKLPEELEYRFVGRRLVLLDTRAQLVVDLMDRAVPS